MKLFFEKYTVDALTAGVGALEKNAWIISMIHFLKKTPASFQKLNNHELILVTCAVIATISVLAWLSESIWKQLAFVSTPIPHEGGPWQMVTYGLLHINTFHLVGNLMAAYSFLHLLLNVLTFQEAMTLFVLGTATPAWAAQKIKVFRQGNQCIVGASSGVFALVGASGFLFPNSTLLLFFVIPTPMGLGVLGLFVLSVLFAFKKSLGGIWHFGHAGGLIVGALFAMVHH
jgi:membrane associated rhomboid family serine protease